MGIFTDAFPIFGTRRRSYIIINTSLAAISWAALSFTPHQYGKLLTVALIVNFFMVGFSTALFYRQQDVLHLNTQTQGILQFLGGIGSVAAAMWYGLTCKRVNLRNLLLCLTVSTVTNLGYLVYSSLSRARVIDGINGVGYTMAECALMALAIRATPKGSEGLGFSLMMSVRNFALFGSDIFGSWLLDKYRVPFGALVVSNSAEPAKESAAPAFASPELAEE